MIRLCRNCAIHLPRAVADVKRAIGWGAVEIDAKSIEARCHIEKVLSLRESGLVVDEQDCDADNQRQRFT